MDLGPAGLVPRATVYGTPMDPSLGGHDGPKTQLELAVLGTLFTESPIGLHVLDPDLCLVRFNRAARHIRAFPSTTPWAVTRGTGRETSTPAPSRRCCGTC